MTREFIIDTFLLIQYIALLLVVFYILFLSKFFYCMGNKKGITVKKTIHLTLIIMLFGALSILATETGTIHADVIVYARNLAPIIAGLFRGPLAGLGAGLIGAIHRASKGGIYYAPCSLATLLSGFVAGIYYIIRKKKNISPFEGLIFGTLFEFFHIGLIVLYGYINEFVSLNLIYRVQNPLNAAIEKVHTVGGLMIYANGLGLFLFAFFIKLYGNQYVQWSLPENSENKTERGGL